jgi:hypothetical protein
VLAAETQRRSAGAGRRLGQPGGSQRKRLRHTVESARVQEAVALGLGKQGVIGVQATIPYLQISSSTDPRLRWITTHCSQLSKRFYDCVPANAADHSG